jgi:hypothetical protein
MQSAKCVKIGGRSRVVDRDARHQFGSAIARAPIGIDDYGSLARKAAENTISNGVDDRTDSLGIIVSGQAYKNIHFADVNQLAKKLIRKKSFIFQFQLCASHARAL